MISKRLQTCLSYIKGTNCLLDVGCDHALVCINAIINGYAQKAIASDVVDGPLRQASKNIERKGLTDKITVRKCDGIGDINSNIDTILISGMGGLLIKSILEKAVIGNQKLILLPNNYEPDVRSYLTNNGFEIIDETIVFEKKHYYEVIICRRGVQVLSSDEIEFGPINLKNRSIIFLEKHRHALSKLKEIDLSKIDNPQNIIDKIKVLESIF